MEKMTSHKIKAWHISPESANASDLKNPSALYYTDVDMRENGWLCVGEATITLNIQISEEDLMLSMCDTLRKQIDKVRAEAHEKVNELQDRINKIQALTYQGAV